MEDYFAGMAERWPVGREDYHWHALPGDEMAGRHLAEAYGELAAWPGLVPVRAQWMHIPVQYLAPASTIIGAELAKISRLLQGRCKGIPPLTVTLGRAEVWDTGVVCPARPAYMLRFLQQAISAVSREVTGGRFGVHPSVYCPHLTVARAFTHVDNGPVRAWISDCEAADLTLTITRLVLVAQQHDRREITWRIIDDVALTGEMP